MVLKEFNKTIYILQRKLKHILTEIKYYLYYLMKKNERRQKCFKNLVGKPKGKEPIERPRRR